MEIVYKKWISHGNARLRGGKVVVTIPFFARNDEHILHMMTALGEKLQKKLDQKEKHQIFHSDGVLLFWERIAYVDLPACHTSQERNDFFVAELFSYANPYLQQVASSLGFERIPLNIRKVSSKRGSCTYDNRIMLNQDLVHLPTKMIQYVIVHEACHLVEKNHRSSFWNLVSQYFPDYKTTRAILKQQVFLDAM